MRIVVGDVNDNSPQFEFDEYSANVREDVPIGHIILTIKANDKDKSENINGY